MTYDLWPPRIDWASVSGASVAQVWKCERTRFSTHRLRLRLPMRHEDRARRAKHRAKVALELRAAVHEGTQACEAAVQKRGFIEA